MKTLWLKVFTLVLVMSTASAVSVAGVGQKAKARTAPEKTVVGYISDSSCGLQHMAGMDDESCTLMCAKSGKFVLADREHKVVYDLDKTGQDKAREFAGKKVKVRGRLAGKTIRVTAIEAAA